MRHRVRTSLIAGCLLAWGVAAAWAQPGGRLVGQVRDATGGVLPGVGVTVTGGGTAPRTVMTDAEGRYDLDALPAGHYRVQASLTGFQPETSEVDVLEGPVTLDLVLAVATVLDSVTVTATKTGAADIQTTPIAVTALPERTLEQLGVQAVEGLAGFVPSLTVSRFAALTQVNIRGIGTNVLIGGSDPSSTIHLDGVYLARPAMLYLDFLDIERVEVLRGPQGMLYGRNSVGGTINIVTRQPTNSLEADVRLTAGNYDRLRAEAAVSGPLVKEKVMGSIAFVRGTRNGLVTDLNNPDHPLGSEDTWAARGQLRFVFAARHELLLSADYGSFDGVPVTPYAKPLVAKPGFSFDNPPSLWTVRTSASPPVEPLSFGTNTQQGTAAKLAVRLSDTTTLNSLTASRVFFTPFNTAIQTQAPYALVHVRAGFQPRSRRWELAGYVRNVASQEYVVTTADLPLPAFTAQPGEPRQWGTQFTLRH